MRRPAATVTALGVLFLAAASANSADLAPDWSLKSADGEIVRLSEEIQEQPVILLFWATWCPYCKALMPHLQSMRLEYGDQVKILAINFREDGDPVAFIKNAGYDFTVLPDGDEVAAVYGVYGTPGVIIVDGDQQARFDLRTLPQQDPPANGKPPSHKQKASHRAPYWAAEIRKSIDSVLEGSSQ
ncbi:MAG: TlpA family protein disulfide reductase [Gammaproteobacteria bacterium]|nr:TlpA family protein disulfide reductase [Gammaproteobacteria bacterium]